MERLYATSYLLVIAMFALSFIICEQFAIEMCMTVIWTFIMVQCKI